MSRNNDRDEDSDHGHDLEQRVEAASTRTRVRRFLKYNASLLTGEGAATVYGWLVGTPVAVYLEKIQANNYVTTGISHGADYLAHAVGVGAALYILFRGNYVTEEGNFDRGRFARDNLRIQTAHVCVDVVTYTVRTVGSYFAFREGINPALVMTGSAIGGEVLHWILMNIVGKRLGYFHYHDHSHGHNSHDHPKNGTPSI